MESEYQSWYDFTSNKSSTEKQRALWIIVSWVDGKALLHTNILKSDGINNNQGWGS